MGNYYGGTLKFFIRRDITKEDFIDLKMMADGCAQKELYSKKLQESSWFQHKRWIWVCAELFYLCSYEAEGKDERYLISVDEEEVPENVDPIGYMLDVTIHTKGYRYGGNDLGEAIVDSLIDMCDISLYNDAFGTIGRIRDEDCTYDREFHMDEEGFKKHQENMKFLCEGCSSWSDEHICDHWDKCLRAYEIGKKKNS